MSSLDLTNKSQVTAGVSAVILLDVSIFLSSFGQLHLKALSMWNGGLWYTSVTFFSVHDTASLKWCAVPV